MSACFRRSGQSDIPFSIWMRKRGPRRSWPSCTRLISSPCMCSPKPCRHMDRMSVRCSPSFVQKRCIRARATDSSVCRNCSITSTASSTPSCDRLAIRTGTVGRCFGPVSNGWMQLFGKKRDPYADLIKTIGLLQLFGAQGAALDDMFLTAYGKAVWNGKDVADARTCRQEARPVREAPRLLPDDRRNRP